MPFSKENATKIVERARFVAETVLEMTVEGDYSVRSWLVDEGADLANWPFHATVVCAFLALEEQAAGLPDEEFRRFAALVNESLFEWDEMASGAFYELADFVVSSAEQEVGFVSACGLWIVLQIMMKDLTMADLTKAYDIGCLFHRVIAPV